MSAEEWIQLISFIVVIVCGLFTIYYSRRATKEWRRAEQLWKQAAADWKRVAEIRRQAGPQVRQPPDAT